MYNVVVVSPIPEQGLALLRQRSDVHCEIANDFSPKALACALRNADAITVRTVELTPQLLDLAPALKVVSRFGVGVNLIPVDYLTARGIPVAITVDANVSSVAEHTLMLMLSLAKKTREGDAAVREQRFIWRNTHLTGDLRNKSLLLVGCGRIGQRVGHLCAAFGMHIEVYDPYLSPDKVQGMTLVNNLHEALSRADFVSMHTPCTPETRHMLNAEAFAAMKRGATLINCSRGETIDEAALCEAIRNGHLGGAGLDVFEGEILPSDSPLLQLDNVLLSPHNAALSVEGSIRMATQAAQNVLDALDGKLRPEMIFNRRGLEQAGQL